MTSPRVRIPLAPPSGPFGTDCASLCVFMGLFGSVVFLGVACLPIFDGHFAWNPCGIRHAFCRGWRMDLNPARIPRRKARFHACCKAAVWRLHRSKSAQPQANFKVIFQRIRSHSAAPSRVTLPFARLRATTGGNWRKGTDTEFKFCRRPH